MEYKIISGSDHEDVSKQITESLDNRWELRGELIVTPFSHDDEDMPDYCIYTQVMTKQETESDANGDFMEELGKA